jgi:iron complex outermembrane receptor protein
MKRFCLFFTGLFFITNCFSQTETSDSTVTIDTVIVRSFEQWRRGPVTPILICTITPAISQYSSKTSLLNGLNAVAGVRMEERSPGSYRLSIRGSSLRSPFGVRNIKVYWNDIPVTDPGGNTYFNQFAWNNFSHAEIFKGPAGSLYGAGTGGLVLLNNFSGKWEPGASIEYLNGSFGLHNIFGSVRFGQNESKNQITYAHNQVDGYRVQTNMRRDNLSWTSQIKKAKHELTASLLFTDMYYQTPGALTLAEFNTDPKAARPAAGGFPSAVNAKAAIYQKNLLVGLSNIYTNGGGIKNTTTLYGSYAQIKNPAIRNYEKRTEPSFGARSFFSYDKSYCSGRMKFIVGTEFQQGDFNTQVSKNRNGEPDTLQTDDDIDNRALAIFAQADIQTDSRWHFIAGVSLNKNSIKITRLNNYPVVSKSRNYRNELAPKFSLMKDFNAKFYWLASVSRGFSPPTIPEVLPSTGVISTELEAENGWNYETTLKAFLFRKKLLLELTAFYFKLKDALVQRRDLSGADFFVNAGDVKQRGIEFHGSYSTYISSDIFNRFSVRTDITYNYFRYGSFIKGPDDFSGKKVPSVPSSVITILTDLEFNKGFYMNANYYGASSIYMNDANTAKAEPYHLLGSQLGWKKRINEKILLNIYAGADNILDEKYSLGNDINAAANRFYNAAPPRNYYAGLLFQWIYKAKT